MGGGKAMAFVSIEVKSLAELNTAISRLRVISGVSDVKRPGVQ